MAFDQVAYVREWRKRNEMAVYEYRRRALLKRAQRTGTFPRLASIRKYDITWSELKAIIDAHHVAHGNGCSEKPC